MIEDPIPIDRTTCILTSLSLDGRLVPFYGLVPAIQQAVLLRFKWILLSPVDVRFLEGSLTAELVPLSYVLRLIGYLRGQLSLEMDLPQQFENRCRAPLNSDTIQSIWEVNERSSLADVAGGFFIFNTIFHHLLLCWRCNRTF